MIERLKALVAFTVLAPLMSMPTIGERRPSRAEPRPPSLVSQVASRLDSGERNADTLSVVIYRAVLAGDGTASKLGPPLNPAEDHVFKSGELVTVSFTPTFEAYVYFINRGPKRTSVIFPVGVANIKVIPSNETHNVFLQFDNEPGREELIVIVSRDRLSKLDNAVATPDQVLDTKDISALEDADSGHTHDKSVPPRPNNKKKGKKPVRDFDRAGLIAANSRWGYLASTSSGPGAPTVRSRDMHFFQEEGNSSVQVRPVADGKNGYKFGRGQVGAFSISFDHR